MHKTIKTATIIAILILLIIGAMKLFEKSIYMHVQNTNIYGNIESSENITMKRVNFVYYIDESRIQNLGYQPSIETLFIFDEKKNYISQVPTIETIAERGGFEEKHAVLYLSCDIPELKTILDLFKKNGFIYMKQAFASVPFSIFPNPKTDFMTLYVDKEKLKDLQCK